MFERLLNRLVAVGLGWVSGSTAVTAVNNADPVLLLFAWVFFVGALACWMFGGRERELRP